MSNHVKVRDWKRGGSRYCKAPRYRSNRAKTFKTMEAAEAYAKEQGFKKFEIVDMHEGKQTNKFKVVEQ